MTDDRGAGFRWLCRRALVSLFILVSLLVELLPADGTLDGGVPGTDCSASHTNFDTGMGYFYNVSSDAKTFKWIRTRSGDGSYYLRVHAANLVDGAFATLISESGKWSFGHHQRKCILSFRYKMLSGHFAVKQRVDQPFLPLWCSNEQQRPWRTLKVKMHPAKDYQVLFDVSPNSSTLDFAIDNITLECCRSLTGCQYYPSPNFVCGMAGFHTPLSSLGLSDEQKAVALHWKSDRIQGQLKFTSRTASNSSDEILSPSYWWSSPGLSECRVNFYSGAMINRRLGTRAKLAIYKLGEDTPVWAASGHVLTRRGGQHYSFKIVSRSDFQLLFKASAWIGPAIISISGLSVHCCPVRGVQQPAVPPSLSIPRVHFTLPSPPVITSLVYPTTTAKRQTTMANTPVLTEPSTTSTGSIVEQPEDTISVDTALNRPDASRSDNTKEILIPISSAAVLLMIVVAIMCCKQKAASSNCTEPTVQCVGLSTGRNTKTMNQSSLNNPGYEDTIPLQAIGRQENDAADTTVTTDATTSQQPKRAYENSVLPQPQHVAPQQDHHYENTTLGDSNSTAQDESPQRSKQNPYDNVADDLQVQSKPHGYENVPIAEDAEEHSGATLPLGTPYADQDGFLSRHGEPASPATSDHHYHRLDTSETNAASAEVHYQRPYMQPPCTADAIYSHLAERSYLRINRRDISLMEGIGSGHFATVYQGRWRRGDAVVSNVAVKTLCTGSSTESTIRFLREAAVMGQFRHDNIVRLYGVVTDGEPMMMVLELMSTDLRKHLCSLQNRKRDRSLHYHLLRICRHIAAGMQYLAGRQFVHRDLAARNVMIDQHTVSKIGDFGMARDISADQVYVSGKERVFPIKWTAPEAIEFIQFTSASDVWSYGIVLFEIWSLGERPYAQWTNEEVFHQVKSGFRLPAPKKCPHSIFYLMLQCWQAEKESRPSFSEIVECLADSDDSLLAY